MRQLEQQGTTDPGTQTTPSTSDLDEAVDDSHAPGTSIEWVKENTNSIEVSNGEFDTSIENPLAVSAVTAVTVDTVPVTRSPLKENQRTSRTQLDRIPSCDPQHTDSSELDETQPSGSDVELDASMFLCPTHSIQVQAEPIIFSDHDRTTVTVLYEGKPGRMDQSVNDDSELRDSDDTCNVMEELNQAKKRKAHRTASYSSSSSPLKKGETINSTFPSSSMDFSSSSSSSSRRRGETEIIQIEDSQSSESFQTDQLQEKQQSHHHPPTRRDASRSDTLVNLHRIK